jgi:hypothetical protein
MLGMNLEELEVASPCHESWEAMTGDERSRFCSKCKLSVFNLSSMTRLEAETFVRSRQPSDETCIRFYRRFDGTVITRDCPVALRKRRLALLGLKTAATTTAAALVAAAIMVRPSSSSGGGSLRVVYENAKSKILMSCDQISHKFGITSLCNCRVMVMGAISVAPPRLPPAPPGTSSPATADPFLPQELPSEDPFAPTPSE